ncbi:MAG: ABC transporter ATP-binding protein/permease [Candidatus Tectomicrobia bacterium]|nr:ABC transporter ATP-binding protein/permease [Candidatus Tectomicrobia bacterium]
MKPDRQGDLGILRRLLQEARPYWPHLTGILLLDLFATPLALLSPLPLKIVVDSVLGTEALPEFLSAAIPIAWREPSALLILAVTLLIVTALLTQLQSLAASFLRAYAGGRMVLDFRNLLFGHGQRMSLARHDMKGVTDALYRIQYDTAAIETVAINGLIPVFVAVVTVIAMIYITAKISLQLALVALFIVPLIVILTKAYRQPLRNRWRKQKRLDHAALSVINEVFSALRVVKAYTQEERETERYADQARQGLRARLKVTLLQGSFDLAASLATALGTGIVLFFGVRAIQSGAITIGDLLIVMAYLGLLYGPLKTIGGRVASLQNAFASAERAFSFLDEIPDVPEKPNALAVDRVRGEFRLERVCFSYDATLPVLTDVSLTIPAGTRVGIAGTTGAGKTTLVSLLMRFYDPTSGTIRLDGVDIRDYKLKDFRRQFAMVLQDTILFSTTIKENIAYARPEATDGEIIAAAQAAHADDFIAELPEGYETLVGDRGMRLSGGERQRVALARAFLRDAPVLLLDEPTSALDAKTETVIMEVMNRLMKGRTTIMIAHRVSTLRNCDLQLEVKDGHVAIARSALDIQACSGGLIPTEA